jgi:tetratricopeptide (TPR) repeat protein
VTFRYKYVFFVDASSVESIKADLQSAIRSLGGTHSQDTFEDALRFLAHPDNHDCLLIFDNADDPNLLLTTFLPECDHGTIIITGRNNALVELAPNSQWRLEGMSESQSVQVLRNAAKRETFENEQEAKAAYQLCTLLGGLPLALVQVGCYCNTTKITFSEYLERFQLHRPKLMAIRSPLQLDKYNYSTYTSIGLSYSLLDAHARDLLYLLAFFHPQSVCLDILRAASKYGFEVDEDWELLPRDDQYHVILNTLRRLLTPAGTWNDIYIDHLLHQLQSSSLLSLSRSNDQTYITIHPLVQSCILDTLASEAYSLHFYMAVQVLSSCSRVEQMFLFQHLPAHIAELDGRKMTIHPNDASRLAYVVFVDGNYEKAMSKWEEMSEECWVMKGEEHKFTLEMRYWIAECFYTVFKHEEAEVMILGMVKAHGTGTILGEDDNTLDSYPLPGWSATRQRKTKKSEQILKRILALSKNTCNQEDAKTVIIQWSLAANLFMQRRYVETEVTLRNIWPMVKDVFGENHAVTLMALNILSVALMNQGKWTEAGDVWTELIAHEKIKYGEYHANTIISRFNFALCLLQRGHLDEAEKILWGIVELQEKILGKDHTHTLSRRGKGWNT